MQFVENRQSALEQLSVEPPEMVVLECVEHGLIDLLFCQKVRNIFSGLFLLLSDLNHSQFQIFALNIGVDATLARSASGRLIAANISALLRRFVPVAPPTQLIFGDLILDMDRRDAFIHEKEARLSTVEFDIFQYLVHKQGCVVSREEIHRAIYQTDYNGYERSIDLYISRIRQKIGDSLYSPVYLKTVRGAGYQFIGIPDRRNDQLAL